jgi:O-antigen/teichoic acid export membrane protein
MSALSVMARVARVRESLSSPARRGAVWTAIGFGGGQLLRFAGNLILARLLLRDAFGVTAVVGSILQLFTLFTDIGIGPGIIQNARGEDRTYLRTAFTLQALRGVLIWLGVFALATPLASYYEEPELAAVAPIGALSVLVASFASTKLFVAQKRLDLKRITQIEIASQVVGLCVQVGWALQHPTVWALVAGGLTTSIVKTVLSHLALPGERDGFGWDADAAHALVRFGKWIFLSTVLTYCVTQADKLVFFKLVPAESVGDYSIASQIALLPALGIGAISLSVAFPHYTRLFHAKEPLGPTFHRTRARILLLAGWMCAGLIAGGPAAIAMLYKPEFVAAGWIVQALASGGWFFALEATNGAVLLACDRARWVAAANGAKLAAMIVLIPIGHERWGFFGAVAAYAASDVPKWIASVIGAGRLGLAALGRDVAYTAHVAGVAAASIWLQRELLPADVGKILPAVFVLVTVTALYAPFAFLEIRRLARNKDSA